MKPRWYNTAQPVSSPGVSFRRRRSGDLEYSLAVTADDFRELALSLEDATEKSHMGHPDFRANGRIFSTLGPGALRNTSETNALDTPTRSATSCIVGRSAFFFTVASTPGCS